MLREGQGRQGLVVGKHEPHQRGGGDVERAGGHHQRLTGGQQAQVANLVLGDFVHETVRKCFREGSRIRDLGKIARRSAVQAASSERAWAVASPAAFWSPTASRASA
jgi:hypothetical protein